MITFFDNYFSYCNIAFLYKELKAIECYSLNMWTDFGLGLGFGQVYIVVIIISLQWKRDRKARDLEVM